MGKAPWSGSLGVSSKWSPLWPSLTWWSSPRGFIFEDVVDDEKHKCERFLSPSSQSLNFTFLLPKTQKETLDSGNLRRESCSLPRHPGCAIHYMAGAIMI